MTLRWIGNTKGADGIPDIPARDLTDAEAAQYGGAAALIATGLYEKVAAENPRGRTSESEDGE